MRNGGNPLNAIDLATAIGKSPGSSTIRTLNASASASASALTGGSYKSTFAMDMLGQAITSPKSPEEKARSLVDAALHPAVFKSVYDYYKGKKLPEKTFLVNILVRQFDVEAGNAAETFAGIFLANMASVGPTRTTSSGEWLTNDPDVARAGTNTTHDPGDGMECETPQEEIDEPPPPQKRPPAPLPVSGRSGPTSCLSAMVGTRSRWSS